jgi:hypothetical protein
MYAKQAFAGKSGEGSYVLSGRGDSVSPAGAGIVWRPLFMFAGVLSRLYVTDCLFSWVLFQLPCDGNRCSAGAAIFLTFALGRVIVVLSHLGSEVDLIIIHSFIYL